MADAEEQVLAYVKEHVPEARKAPLAGNTIGTDRAFLARDMPSLEGHVHYRNVDVSSLQGARPPLVSRGSTSTPRPRAATTARWPTSASRSRRCATTATRCSSPGPGPDTATCKEIAARHQGTLTPAGRRPTEP